MKQVLTDSYTTGPHNASRHTLLAAEAQKGLHGAIDTVDS